ncbi:MAG: hypothetical protein K2K98_02000 [Muribaculaceae bacterium]|nr:hypothetical protein [Muribaculaceae bacterium]
MKTIVNKIIYTVAFIASLMICSCSDDFPNLFGEIPEGEGNLTATVTFTPTLGANLKATRTAGDAIQTINSLCVLVYTAEENGNLVRKYTMDDLSGYNETSYTVDADKDHLDGNQAHTDEEKTAQATFTLPGLPYGTYKIYAVANMGDLTDYEDAIQSEGGLRNISLHWKTGDKPEESIADNNQMFGYFTPSNNMDSKGLVASPLVFSNKQTKIHAWLKRAASKVTVAFDPSGLNQDVNIYIKSVTIHDIPSTCLLGNVNIPTNAGELLNHLDYYDKPNYSEDVKSEVVPNTRFYYNDNGIIMSNDDNPQPITTWAELPGDIQTEISTNERYGLLLSSGIRNAIPEGAHSSTAQSLFFYENNQMKDEYRNNPLYNKRPEPVEDGKSIRDDKDGKDFKDRVPLGTYIEVEAYYISSNPKKVGEGTIKYRFMLGKDIDYDYNAQRNYHFKLTLGFNGWANDPDWHIDFELPEPGIEVPPEFRVSYLYYQKSELPIRILGDCTKLVVTIEENNWAPYDPTTSTGLPPEGESSTSPDPLYAFKWNSAAYYNSEYMNYNSEYLKRTVNNPAFGFLALHLPNLGEKTIIQQNHSATANAALINYYKTNKEGEREFNKDQLNPEIDYTNTSGNDGYKVTYVYKDNGDRIPNQKTLLLPVWTRAKSLIEDSGFSGNNPYEGFERKAVLNIHAEFANGSEDNKEVTVYQVKRLVNPKGVWRDKGRSEPFYVTLLEAENANGMSNFMPFTSKGEWSAHIEGSSYAGFSLSKHPDHPDDCYLSEDGKTIHGYSDTEINFTINFGGGSVGDNKSECAIVKVLYHGNQCLHKILVRKGYGEAIEMGGNTWSSFSLYQATYREGTGDRGSGNDEYDAVLTKNPLMLGSMFRRGRQDYGILVKNNMESEGGVGPLLPPGRNFEYMVANKINGEWERRTWGGTTTSINPTPGIIGYRNDLSSDRGLGKFVTEDGTKYRVPSYEDWWNLTYDENTEFGFGVVYGSAATKPQITAEGAYGLIDPDNTGEFTDERGMRGIIVYNKEDGNQIFFPVGKYGTGRRQMFQVPKIPATNGQYVEDPNYYGVLRYADVYEPLTTGSNHDNLYRPIPYNLPIAAGNIYWIDKRNPNGGPINNNGTRGNCLGWDLNYFNFDFNPYTANNYRDACPIKLILDK